jgi:hypothetical protein
MAAEENEIDEQIRDEITGIKAKVNRLNKKNLSKYELDDIFLGEP